MKRTILLITLLFASVAYVQSQKIAYVNTETILGAVPQYTQAQKQLETQNQRYQSQIEQAYNQLDQLYTSYKNERSKLSDQQRQLRQDAILNREKEIKEQQESYFGQEGEMAKLSKQLMDPIMEKVQSAIDAVAQAGGYAFIYDLSSNNGIIYKNAAYDLSNKVIEKLGYKN